MTPALRRPTALRTRVLLLIALPLGVWAAGQGLATLGTDAGVEAAERRLRRQGDRLLGEFRGLLADASSVARTALERSPADARASVRGSRLRDRAEGVGRLGPDGAWIDWEGTPVEPAGPGSRERAATARVEGFWTRLVVRAGPDADGRESIASFLLDSPFARGGFSELLSRRIDRRMLSRVDFVDSDEPDGDLAEFFEDGSGVLRAGPPAVFYVPLTSPGGDVLALATLEDLPPSRRAMTVRARTTAAAAGLLAALLLALFPWRRLCETPGGLSLSLAAVAAGRAALLLARAPSRLLPRELGAPTLYGTPAAWGALGSPADLLLTALALYLAATAVRRFLATSAPRRLALPISWIAALALTSVLVALSVSLARDARVALLKLQSLPPPGGQALLLAGLAIAIVAAGEMWACAIGSLRIGPVPRLRLVGSVLALAALSSFTLLATADRMALERLRAEFAPQVVEQASRRRVALLASVREAASSDRAIDAVLAPDTGRDRYAAYLVWAGGDLFHSGYHSSLDFYDAAETRRSHFGFNLPPLDDPTAPPAVEPGLVVREEFFTEGALRLRVLHAEAAIVHEGQPVGIVVGHVLDEPENLPFLPWSSAYLSALGPGAPRIAREDPSNAPGYVLYGAAGGVVLSTLSQPPATSPALREAAERRETVRVVAGGEPFVALPLLEGGRLHLLLLSALGSLDRLGAWLRLSLASLLLLGVLALLRAAGGPEGIASIPRAVRGSFYRKLVATLLVASVVPVIGLALFVRGYVENRAQVALGESATRLAGIVKRVVEDYAAADPGAAEAGAGMNDEILHWLRRVVGQEIHVYENGRLTATSKRELFASGLLPPRLPGEVHARLAEGGLPSLVRESPLGPGAIPVAYTRLRLPGPDRDAVAAVPMVLEQREISRAIERVAEMLLLASVLLAGLLATAAAVLARSVARPVRELAAATRRIAAGDYAARLEAHTRDEVAALVEGFNAMAAALAAQRADLERRRDYIETLLRHATMGVISTDASGRIVTVNPAATALLCGAGPPLRVGEVLSEAVAERPGGGPLARALAETGGIDDPREVDLERGERARRLRLVRVALPDPSGGAPGSLFLVDDVTDLMRSNQLAAWAEMARAIAHEIKNPLTPIQLSTEHLERILRDRRVIPSPEVEACLETVIKQVRSLREIAAEFSAYAKLPDLAPVPTDPVAFMREVIAPYRAARPAGLRIEERYEPAPVIAADRRVLSRAVVNLVENALQAMSAKGTLTVAVENGGPPDGGVVLTVADTGPGLDPRVRAHLFEPYFSTKSSGTGLGLAIVRRAVEAHRGSIEVDSDPQRGTRFRIRLPAA